MIKYRLDYKQPLVFVNHGVEEVRLQSRTADFDADSDDAAIKKVVDFLAEGTLKFNYDGKDEVWLREQVRFQRLVYPDPESDERIGAIDPAQIANLDRMMED